MGKRAPAGILAVACHHQEIASGKAPVCSNSPKALAKAKRSQSAKEEVSAIGRKTIDTSQDVAYSHHFEGSADS